VIHGIPIKRRHDKTRQVWTLARKKDGHPVKEDSHPLKEDCHPAK
jgi:hypothetical protein